MNGRLAPCQLPEARDTARRTRSPASGRPRISRRRFDAEAAPGVPFCCRLHIGTHSVSGPISMLDLLGLFHFGSICGFWCSMLQALEPALSACQKLGPVGFGSAARKEGSQRNEVLVWYRKVDHLREPTRSLRCCQGLSFSYPEKKFHNVTFVAPVVRGKTPPCSIFRHRGRRWR